MGARRCQGVADRSRLRGAHGVSSPRVSSDPRVVRLAILDSYGVEWPLETFARDVMQNFFDAAPSYRDVTIDGDEAARTLEIRGPAEFDLDLLAYLGATTKHDGRSAGGFGEGFKICALVGARDFGLGIRAGSGDTELEVFFDPVALGKELCYRVAPAATPGRGGSFVRLEGCSNEVFAAFEQARHAFFHDDNPYIGERIATDEEGSVAIHASNLEGDIGEIYYRRQFRGDIEYRTYGSAPVALTLACHRVEDELEGDRDRRVLDAANVARIVGARVAPEGLHAALLALRGHWERGHEVLGGLLAAAEKRALRFSWPEQWLARVPGGKDRGLAAMAERQGFKIAMAAFGALGMRTVTERYSGDLETRAPTPIERARIEASVDLYTALHGGAPPGKPFEVFDSERAAVHGQHLFDKVIVASRLLRPTTFAAGAATVVHELCHEAGGEDEPAFLNRLGRLLGAAIRNEKAVVQARERFERAKPKRVKPAPPEPPKLVAYTPGLWGPGSPERGSIECRVYVPPGFPPTDTIVQRVVAAGAAAGTPVHLYVFTLYTMDAVKHFRVPGLPTVLIEHVDVEPEVTGRPALRLRTYGPEQRVTPGEEAIRVALEGALTRRRRRQRPPAPKTTPAEDLVTRNLTVSAWCGSWASQTDEGLRGGAWRPALEAAGKIRLAALEADPGPNANELYHRVVGEVKAAVALSEELRAGDAAFEAGDALEEEAMGAAQAAFVTGFAAAGRERGERDFRAVREVTAELTGLDVAVDLRSTVLAWCVRRAGLPAGYLVAATSVDVADLREAFAVAAAVATRFQRALDQEERHPDYQELERALDRATPADEARILADEVAKAERARHMARRDRRHAEATHRVKATWETTLAATGSEALAGEACMRDVKRWFRA